jgi:hypothetical protein
MKTEKDKMITDEILLLFEETFKKVEGFYLDKGTSLSESIQNIEYTEASKKKDRSIETIAGHIFHIIYYIRVLQEYITDERTGKTDWNESWIISSVSKEQWKELKKQLIQEYEKLLSFIKSIEEWNNGDYFGGVLSILAHCSYHLGAIRQLITLIPKNN